MSWRGSSRSKLFDLKLPLPLIHSSNARTNICVWRCRDGSWQASLSNRISAVQYAQIAPAFTSTIPLSLPIRDSRRTTPRKRREKSNFSPLKQELCGSERSRVRRKMMMDVAMERLNVIGLIHHKHTQACPMLRIREPSRGRTVSIGTAA